MVAVRSLCVGFGTHVCATTPRSAVKPQRTLDLRKLTMISRDSETAISLQLDEAHGTPAAHTLRAASAEEVCLLRSVLCCR